MRVSAIQTFALRKVYPAPSTKRRRMVGGASLPATAPPVHVSAPVAPGSAPPREIVALVGLDLAIEEGEFFGLLGPNGAGKTTTIGILTTRVRPTSGTATVAGADVRTQEVQVRQRIGVVPQRPNADRSLNVRENLVFHAAYFGIARQIATARAHALLEQLGNADKADAKVDQHSGGQQQRLMIARALIHEPSIIFLDEPTVGLDPQARLDLWEILRALHAEGRTIVMTTHYMEEADRLCQRLAIVDRGVLLALDTPGALKARAPGGTLVELSLDADAAAVASDAAALPGVLRTEARGNVLQAYAERAGELIASLVRVAEQHGREVRDIHLAPPSLETLFISLTGRKLV